MAEEDIRIPSGYEDDTFADPSPDDTVRTPLQDLAAVLSQEVTSEPITLVVPARNGVKIRFDTNIDLPMLQMWRRRSKVQRKDEYDEMKFSRLVIANQAMQIIFNGQEANGVDGKPLNFRHRELWSMLNVDGPQNAVTKMFGIDGHIMNAAQDVVRAAGFDDADMEDDEDPTMRS